MSSSLHRSAAYAAICKLVSAKNQRATPTDNEEQVKNERQRHDAEQTEEAKELKEQQEQIEQKEQNKYQ